MRRTNNSMTRWTILVLTAMVTVGASGCASWRSGGASQVAEKLDIPDGVPWRNKGPRTGAPRRMVATWTDAVRHQAGAPSERGFGGRLFFYDRDDAEPIRVEGQLVVYAFDEADRLPTDNRPNKRYVFPVEQFAKHETDSEMGVSYSVWLPWDKMEGTQTDVSLIARFEPAKGGTLIVSDQARERLPGRLTESDVQLAGKNRPAAKPASGGVQQVAYQTASPAPSRPSPGLETTTIRRPSAQVSYGPLHQ